MKYKLKKISNEELIRILVSNTPVGYIVLDRNYRIHFMNEHFMKMRNFDKEKVYGKHCYDLSNGGEKCNVCAVEGTIVTKINQKVMRKDILPNGEVRFIEDYAIPLYKDDNMNFDFIFEIMVNRTSEMIYREQLDRDFINLISSLITMLEEKDEYTATHSKTVAKWSVMLAKTIGLSSEQINDIEIAASLHDIGKVNIPYGIINKPGRLDDNEFLQIQKHPGNSYVILQRLTGFNKVKEYARYHHERYDGKGYPDGLKSEEIPLGARIISIADTYDAMTSTRSYRKVLSHEIAIEEIKKNAGTQFDPRLVKFFVNMDFDNSNMKAIRKKNIHLVERQIFESDSKESIKDDSLARYEDFDFKEILSENKFIEQIFNNTPVSYIVLTPEYDVVYASPFFLSTFGLNMRDIEGKKCFEASGIGAKCPNCPMAKAVKIKQLIQEELVQTINGQTRYFDCYAMPYFDKEGELVYILEILLDRTDEVLLQKEHEHDLYNIIQMLMDLLYVNDQMTFIKSKFIRELCDVIIKGLSLSKDEEKEIDMAATLCDIGMISIKDAASENEEMNKTHPLVAYNILSELSIFTNIKDVIKHHHELFNGKGYPDGLAGNDIPLGSRVINLADAYYELSKISQEYALEQLKKNEDGMFDPHILEVFLNHVDEKAGIE